MGTAPSSLDDSLPLTAPRRQRKSNPDSPPKPRVDLKRLHAGDPAHLDELLAAAEPDLTQVIRRWAKGDQAKADDLLQEARVRIYRKRASYSGSGSFWRWADRVCLNVCRAQQRLDDRCQTVALDECDEIADDAPGPVEELLLQARAEVVHKALDQLGERERDAAVARYLEGRSTCEVASKMGVTNKVARTLLDRALRRLRTSEDVMDLMDEE